MMADKDREMEVLRRYTRRLLRASERSYDEWVRRNVPAIDMPALSPKEAAE